MTLTLKDMLAEANSAVEKIDAETARRMVAEGALLLDVRDASELVSSGRAEEAHHIPRGMLEFRADPDSPAFDGELSKDRAIVLFCAAGGRAALAGKLLRDMGYEKVYNLGGLKDWLAEMSDGASAGQGG